MSRVIRYLDEDICVLAEEVDRIFSQENGADAIALYMFYRVQGVFNGNKNTDQTFSFQMKSLRWGRKRLINARNVLIKNSIITND